MKDFGKKQKSVVGVMAVVILGLGWWIFNERFEDTDNAYTAAHVATLSPKVGGLVTAVLVEENYKVKRDQILVRLDQRDYKNALDNLQAELGAVEASLVLAEKDFHRSVRLFAQNVVTEQDRDTRTERYQELLKKRDGLRSQVAQAELNLNFTAIRAPADGTVGKKLIEAGMVVVSGQPLLSFVDGQTPWVVANFKETQLKKMKIGQRCDLEIDSIGGKVFQGVIESFSPGTGATFALIPPENATGNFTKIVQRVPVRIRFMPESVKGYEDRLVPGLSAEAKVRLLETPLEMPQILAAEAKLIDK